MTDVTGFVDCIMSMSTESAGVAKHYFRHAYDIELKLDKSPVTAADKDIEALLRRVIESRYPDHSIYGEEMDDVQHDSDYAWYIDPIDGTSAFIAGRPLFGILIGLTYKGKPIVGGIFQPIQEECWVGAGNLQPSSLNGALVNTSRCSELSKARLATTGEQYFSKDELAQFKSVQSASGSVLFGGDCYNYASLASGWIDVVVEAGLKPYDYMALVPVIEGAGGVVTDWSGNPLTQDSGVSTVVASANQALHNQVLERLQA